MRVLVTGGAGFIGSSTALALAARHPGWELVACDSLYRRGSELNLPRLKAAGVAFVHADVRRLDDLLRIGPIDALVECSAEPSVMAGRDVIVPVDLVGAHHCFELIDRRLGDRGHWDGRTYNVGGGRAGSLSLLETTGICRELTGNQVRITPVSDTRAGDVRCYLSDCSALYAHTDWRPRRTPQDVLEDNHGWISEHEDLVRTALV